MADKPLYRFHCSITDEFTGETVIADYCGLTSIDQFGGCESVDMHAASMLRAFQRTAKAEYEAREYPQNESQLVTQTAARIRAVVAP